MAAPRPLPREARRRRPNAFVGGDLASLKKINRLLVANRSEIAIRIFRAATELGIEHVGIYAEEDKLSLHRVKADQAYKIGVGKGPIEAYLDIDEIIGVAKATGADAVHPGYGFLAESPEFAEACSAAGVAFIGPSPDTMRALGNKVSARDLAISVDVPVVPASKALSNDADEIRRMADEIGLPVMLKASWGGGGRGMRPITDADQLVDAVRSARREAAAAFGKDEVYFEKLITRARHVEVQILGDTHGNLVHLFERECSVQRRNQKVIERAPAAYLDGAKRQEIADAALKIGQATNYVGAGTVEFLLDADTGEFYFIEVNPRIQVEHTVTEVVTGLDIVKAQIRIAEGGRIGEVTETGIPTQDHIVLDGHAIQCRITTENPENNFIPDYGRITSYRGAFGFGIRVDGGTAYSGAVVTRFYDPLLEKIVAWAPTADESVARMLRALREYRIRGVATNLPFLETVLKHPRFQADEITTRFIDETPELLRYAPHADRASRLATYVADVTVNGHPEARGRATPAASNPKPVAPRFDGDPPNGTKQLLDSLGAEGFAKWMRDEKRALVTDTTMRDAHQSLLATRMRSFDIINAAESYATGLPELFSLECWGGATFDVAMRFLTEDPWERLIRLRERVPNILLQMLLRGANAVGYKNYPDNVVRYFVQQAATAGMDVFRIFDCLNWVENMRVAIDAVGEAGKIAEGAICYTGDIQDPSRDKYSLSYYVKLARELEAAGCHILGIKDMAGLLKPAAATKLVSALKQEVGIPIHLHTHDTSGLSAATILAAVDAGVDAFDAAMDAMSGTVSQPTLGSLVQALARSDRSTELSPDRIREISFYWEAVRGQYAAFESDLKSGASEVYLHEMPGGQYTNLREQARSMGLAGRWHNVAKAYHAANELFGDIVKVTPSSKVVGDLALMMVSQDLSPEAVLDPAVEIAFPQSVVEMMRGDLGQPPGGWPKAFQDKVLKSEEPISVRPGSLLPAADLAAERAEAEKLVEREITDTEFASYLMYPKVFVDFAAAITTYGPVTHLPTPVYFYGMANGDEISVDYEPGRTIIMRMQLVGDVDEEGQARVFFELNGQPRMIRVPDRDAASHIPERRKASETEPGHVAASMPGVVATISVKVGQKVKAGDPLFTIEAMKMETSQTAAIDGTVEEILIQPGGSVEAKDLVMVIAPKEAE